MFLRRLVLIEMYLNWLDIADLLKHANVYLN